MENVVQVPHLRTGFHHWLCERLALNFPRASSRGSLKFNQTLFLKGKGLSRSALDVVAKQTRFSLPSNLTYCACRSVLPSSTYYKRLRSRIGSDHLALGHFLKSGNSVHVHWIDNFQRFVSSLTLDSGTIFRTFARNSAHLTREFYSSLAWTAHGVKIWPMDGNLNYVFMDGVPITATPSLALLLDANKWASIAKSISAVGFWYYETAHCVVRDILRVPVKPSPSNHAEKKHLDRSYDGLSCFYPFDIYPVNISGTEGLLTALKQCQEVDGFGLAGGTRDNQYSILMSDITIYWQLFRILHSFTGLAPIRHDLFSVLGVWHTYQHAHRLLWSEFRSTFLASAFFTLWPNETLLLEPKLKQSSTFISWLRIAYARIRPDLLAAYHSSKLDLFYFLFAHCVVATMRLMI